MNTENLEEYKRVFTETLENNHRYEQNNKRSQILLGCLLLFLSFILIGILIFLTDDLAVQQALVAIAGILILAAIDIFRSTRNNNKLDFLSPTIKLDNRTWINGDYVSSSVGKISSETSNHNQIVLETAADIQRLLNHVSETHPLETTQEKMIIAAEVVDEIDSDPTFKQRVISAIKAGGIVAFESMLTHPAAAITVAALEGWQSEEETEQQED